MYLLQMIVCTVSPTNVLFIILLGKNFLIKNICNVGMIWQWSLAKKEKKSNLGSALATKEMKSNLGSENCGN